LSERFFDHRANGWGKTFASYQFNPRSVYVTQSGQPADAVDA
jgi:hypothetical protein